METRQTIQALHSEAQHKAFDCYVRRGRVPKALLTMIRAAEVLEQAYAFAEQQERHKRLAAARSKYSPSQPRAPAGSPDGGQWVDAGGGRGGNMDIDKTIEYLNAHAENRSVGLCAMYVRKAIQAGGVKLKPPYPRYAKDYDSYLVRYGFHAVSPTPPPDYKPRRGDIVVIQSMDADHPAGHIEIFNGREWVSDYFQGRNDLWPGSIYRRNKPPYKIYRQ